MSIVLHCSKKQKNLQNIGEYWKRSWEAYEQRSDKAPETGSQDSEDHGVWPTDPNMMSYTKKKHHEGGCFTPVVPFNFLNVSKFSYENDNGACWLEQLLLCLY